MTLQEALDKLQQVQSFGSYWKARCPAHDDKVSSLSVREGDKQALVLHCFAGCEFKDILAALSGSELLNTYYDVGSSVSGTPSAGNESEGVGVAPRGPASPRTPVATYEYKLMNGRLFARKLRYADKSFEWRDKYDNVGLKGAKAPLYRLNGLRGKVVAFIAEGEKDADTLAALHLAATTNPGGAAEVWTAEYTAQLKAAGISQTVIFFDNDPPGIKHGQAVAQALHEAGLRPKLVALPGVGPKEDVTDWLGSHTKDELFEVIRTTPEFVAVPKPRKRAISRSMDEVEELDVTYLWLGHIPLGFISLIVGVAGKGKSYLTMDLTSTLSTGGKWPDGSDVGPPRYVILVPGEDTPEHVIKPRLRQAGADMSMIRVLEKVGMPDGSSRKFNISTDLDVLEEMVEEYNASVIIMDPVASFIEGKVDIYKGTEVRSFLEPVGEMCAKRQISFIGVMHLSKGQQSTALFQISGSTAFGELPRAIFGVVPDKADRDTRYFTCLKESYARFPQTRVFKLTGAGIEWTGVVDKSADEVMEQGGQKTKKGNRAVEWLRKRLDIGEQYAQTILEDGVVAGLTERVLRTAAEKLEVVMTTNRDDNGQVVGATWALPDEREAF